MPESRRTALGNDVTALPVVAAVEHHHELAPAIDSAPSGVADRWAFAMRIHSTSIGAPRSRTSSRPVRAPSSCGRRRRRQDRRDSPAARAASSRARRRRGRLPRSGPSPPSASADGTRDSACACSARKFRKSHCGMKAMNLQCVGRCEKSATVTSGSPICPQLANFLMRPLQEFVEQAELVHQFAASTGGSCRRENRARNPRAFPARARRRRRAPAESPASCPAGPPPTMQQPVCMVSTGRAIACMARGKVNGNRKGRVRTLRHRASGRSVSLPPLVLRVQYGSGRQICTSAADGGLMWWPP